MKEFEFVPFSEKQRRLHNWWRPGLKTAENDFVIADGAMRSGKTIGCIAGFLLWSQESFSGEAFILAGKTMGALRKNVIQPMLQILKAWGWPCRYIRSGAESRLEIGENFYYLYSAGNETGKNALQGLTAAGCYADEAALARLRAEVEASLEDPFFIGIGEIGLDGFVPGQDQAHAEAVFAECLAIARDYALPASIHVRKSASRVLMHLRRRMPAGGAVHAFNGSDQERESFLQLGLKLGFGGAATYAGSLRIRRHLAEVPEDAWVLETDAPDMPTSRRRDAFAHGALLLDTAPADILEVADAAAMLRALPLEAVAAVSRRNAIAAFPRLAPLLTRLDAFARRGRDTLD